MKKAVIFWLLCIVIACGKQAMAQDPNFHLYLCLGQSNMEGPAAIEAQDTTVNSRFQVIAAMNCPDLGRSQGNWYPAKPPLFRCNTRLSPADYFGRTLVAHLPETIRVGVIPVAVAGSKIEIFDKTQYQGYLDSSATERPWMINMAKAYGGNPYERLVELARAAQKVGVIKGILIHQGESNTGDKAWPSKVEKLYANLLMDLDLSPNSIPLLVGEVVHADQNGACASMNTLIATLPQTIPKALVISSAGLPAVPDRLHFTSESIRKLGKRYAVQMLSLLGYPASEKE